MYERWRNERNYENWSKYAKEIREAFAPCGKVVKVAKRPFGATFHIEDAIASGRMTTYEISLGVTKTHVKWRIKKMRSWWFTCSVVLI